MIKQNSLVIPGKVLSQWHHYYAYLGGILIEPYGHSIAVYNHSCYNKSSNILESFIFVQVHGGFRYREWVSPNSLHDFAEVRHTFLVTIFLLN